MEGHLLGGTCALGAALVWAFAMILFKRCGEQVPPLALNLFKNTLAVLLLAGTMLCMDGGFGVLRAYSAGDLFILALSGFLGIAVADTLFFYSLNLVGVSLVSIVDCLYTPFIVFFSWILLSERLVPLQYAGAVLILLAVAITTRHEPPEGRTRGQLLLGIFLGVVNMALMTLGIVIAKPVIEKTPLVASTAVRMAAGSLVLALLLPLLPGGRALFRVFRPSSSWKTAIPGSVLGAYLALILWMEGFKETYASVAGILNQTSTVFAIVLAALLLEERITLRKAVAVVLALAGVVLVMGHTLWLELHAAG